MVQSAVTSIVTPAGHATMARTLIAHGSTWQVRGAGEMSLGGSTRYCSLCNVRSIARDKLVLRCSLRFKQYCLSGVCSCFVLLLREKSEGNSRSEPYVNPTSVPTVGGKHCLCGLGRIAHLQVTMPACGVKQERLAPARVRGEPLMPSACWSCRAVATWERRL